jgi:prolyl-tRNA editing enzyme YbaK/EbsC (Cys-tRNA(Pro) deacylase)
MAMCGSELKPLPDGVQRVVAELERLGHAHAPTWLSDSARTAQEAADALAVGLGQIAKSVIFRRKPDGVAVLVVTAGDRRVSERKVAALVCEPGQKLGRADADFVKDRTGFSIGGVSPVAHRHAPVTLLDASLRRFDRVWAAAGHPHAVFALTPDELPGLTAAPWCDVVEAVS